MTPLIRIQFKELKAYLTEEQFCFPYTAKIGKRTITYCFKRILPSQSPNLTIYVKMMRRTKFIVSCEIDGIVYTDLEKFKEKVEYRTPSKSHGNNQKPHKTIHKR